jgi:dephospho-CoA kinase
VSAPKELQRERVLARDGMSPEKLNAILAQQTPDDVKRAGADFVIDSSQGLEDAFQQVKAIIAALAGREGQAWAKFKR